MDHGIPEVRAAGLLAVMGIFDLAGTTFSGGSPTLQQSISAFLVLRFARNLALFLPFSLTHPASALSLFAVFYG